MKKLTSHLCMVLVACLAVACSGGDGDKSQKEAEAKLAEAQKNLEAVQKCLAQEGKLTAGGACQNVDQDKVKFAKECSAQGGVVTLTGTCDIEGPKNCAKQYGVIGLDGNCVIDQVAACKAAGKFMDMNGVCQPITKLQELCTAQGGILTGDSAECTKCKEGPSFAQCRLDETCKATPTKKECTKSEVYCRAGIDGNCEKSLGGIFKLEACTLGEPGCKALKAGDCSGGVTNGSSFVSCKEAADCTSTDTTCNVLMYLKTCTGAGCPL